MFIDQAKLLFGSDSSDSFFQQVFFYELIQRLQVLQKMIDKKISCLCIIV